MNWKHACQVILKNVSKKELPDPIFKCIAIKFYESFRHFETLNEQNRAWPTLSNIPSENSSTKLIIIMDLIKLSRYRNLKL